MRPRRYGSRGSTIATNEDYGKRLMGLLDSLTMFSPIKPAAESLLYAEDYPVAPFATPEDRFDNLMEDPKYQGLLTDAGMAGQGLPVTAPGIVIGAKAKNFPKALAEKFEKLEESGLSNREAFAETGVYRGPDGKLKYEIDDSQSFGWQYQLNPQEAYKEIRDTAYLDGRQIPEPLAKQLKTYKEMSPDELVKIRDKNTSDLFELRKNNALPSEILEKRQEVEGVIKLLDEMPRKYSPVRRFIQHDELMKSYPDLMEAMVRVNNNLDAKGRYFRPDPETPWRSEYIELRHKPMSDDPMSTMLHELQHGVQFREGFDRGGNPGMFVHHHLAEGKARDLHDDLSMALLGNHTGNINEILGSQKYFDKYDLEKITQKYGFQDPDEMFKYLKKENERRTPFGQYQRLGGEAEARMVQKRMNYTPQDRREVFPLDDYDVPLDELIIQSLLD